MSIYVSCFFELSPCIGLHRESHGIGSRPIRNVTDIMPQDNPQLIDIKTCKSCQVVRMSFFHEIYDDRRMIVYD